MSSESEFISRLKMHPPDRYELAWFRYLGTEPPELMGSTGPKHARRARLVPYRHRTFHRIYAQTFGFFWMPCLICNRPYGGHEAGDSIPDPTRGPGSGVSICSQCTRARNNVQ